jgi:hypothetical protein
MMSGKDWKRSHGSVTDTSGHHRNSSLGPQEVTKINCIITAANSKDALNTVRHVTRSEIVLLFNAVNFSV